MSDTELSRLLLLEISRHLPALERRPLESVEARRALHALKGSLGLAGEPALAQEVARLERRLAVGEEAASYEAAELLRRAEERLLAGEPASEGLTLWPLPPAWLGVRAVDPSIRAQYTAEVSDRLARIDEALSGSLEPLDAAALAYRQVHTIKGAASAVSDEPLAWFCHGLEERIRGGNASPEAATAALAELSRWRGVLGGLLDDASSALLSLRSRGRGSASSTHPPGSEELPAPRWSTRPPTPPFASLPRRSTGSSSARPPSPSRGRPWPRPRPACSSGAARCACSARTSPRPFASSGRRVRGVRPPPPSPASGRSRARSR